MVIKIIIINSIIHQDIELFKIYYILINFDKINIKWSTFNVVTINKSILHLKLTLQVWLILHHYLVSLKIYLFFVKYSFRFSFLSPSIFSSTILSLYFFILAFPFLYLYLWWMTFRIFWNYQIRTLILILNWLKSQNPSIYCMINLDHVFVFLVSLISATFDTIKINVKIFFFLDVHV